MSKSDDYRDRAKRSQKEKQERGRFNFAEGENVIRILPTPSDPERNSPEVFTEYCMHNNVGPNKRYVRCGKDLRGRGKCWLCDVVIPKLQAVGKNKLAMDMASKPIFEVQVATVDADTGEWRGPLRLYKSAGSSAKSLAYKLQGLIASTKKDYVDPKNGYSIIVQRSGTGLTDTVYDVLGAEDEPSRVPKDIVAALKPFVDVIPVYDAERQKASYYGREDEESQAEAPSRRRRAEAEEDYEEEAPRAKKPKPAADEDEEYEDEAPKPKRRRPAEDDEDETPKPKGKHKPADDDEEFDFGGEEDEDVPKPKGKHKPAPVEDEEDFGGDEDVPKPKKPKPADDDEEFDFEDDDLPPVPKGKHKVAVDEDDYEEEAPKPKGKHKPAPVEDEEEDFEEEEPRPKRRPKR